MSEQNIPKNNNNSNTPDLEKKYKKKNFELNFFQRVYRKFWFTLPFLGMLAFIIFISSAVYYYLKTNERDEVKLQKTTLENNIQKYWQEKSNVIKQYTEMKNAYNDYRLNLINFNLVFHTIEKYIPKSMVRERLRIKKEWENVEVTISSAVKGYNEYVAMLNIIDKCNFVDEKTKDVVLNLTKVALWGEKWNEQITDDITFNYRFIFSTIKNKYILQKTYEKALRDFANLSSLVTFDNIILNINNESDQWKDWWLWTDNIKKIVEEKREFISKIAEISDTDENWLYKFETWETFINTLKREQKLASFYIDYLNKTRKKLESIYDSLWENEEDNIIYYDSLNKKKKNKKEAEIDSSWSGSTTWTGVNTEDNTRKWEVVLDIKKEIRLKLENLNNSIIELYVLNQYYKYILNNNYLNSFETIATSGKTYKIQTEEWEEKELKADEYITHLINTEILKEDTEAFEILLKLKPEAERENYKKELFTKYVAFAKNIDKEKVKLLDVKLYSDNFYKNYYNYNLYDIVNKIFVYFMNNAKFDITLLNENIPVSIFKFQVNDQNLLSYKNRFILNLKNDSILKWDLLKILTEDWFIKEMNNLEQFLLETEDIITFNNNNIKCLEKDTKKETNKIYEWVLDKKIEDKENEKEIKELDIIISAID